MTQTPTPGLRSRDAVDVRHEVASRSRHEAGRPRRVPSTALTWRDSATPLFPRPALHFPFSMQHVIVTGAAGFIDSNLIDRLIAAGVTVACWDGLSTGQGCSLAGTTAHPRLRLLRG